MNAITRNAVSARPKDAFEVSLCDDELSCRRQQRGGPAVAGSVPAHLAPEGVPPLSEAKLAVPASRRHVDRPRVRQALDDGREAALTLVAAPAGFGKTTTVRAWCEGLDAALAWVTLDAGDNDPIRFWSYVATAVDRIRAGLGHAALQQLGMSGASTSGPSTRC